MSEKEHSVDFLMIKLLHVYATKIFHQLSHVNLHPGQMPMLDILYRQEGLSQREICSRLCIFCFSLHSLLFRYGDGVPAANGKSSSDLPGG